MYGTRSRQLLVFFDIDLHGCTGCGLLPERLKGAAKNATDAELKGVRSLAVVVDCGLTASSFS